jgi:hypothetical protein
VQYIGFLLIYVQHIVVKFLLAAPQRSIAKNVDKNAKNKQIINKKHFPFCILCVILMLMNYYKILQAGRSGYGKERNDCHVVGRRAG